MQYWKAIIHRVESRPTTPPQSHFKIKRGVESRAGRPNLQSLGKGYRACRLRGVTAVDLSLECIIVHVAIRRCLIRELNLNPAAGGQALTNLLSKTAYATSKMFLTA